MSRPEVTGRKPTSAKPRSGLPSPARGPQVPPAAYSIRGFCEAHGISIDLYFKLQRVGLGPRVMKAGARTLISTEAAADWRRDRETA